MANLDASQFVKSKYLKGSDLDKRKPTRATIQDVDQEEFPEQGTKLVVRFLELDQGIVLNKTQTRDLIAMFGAQTGTWRGQRVNLMQVPSSYPGKPTILITEAEPAPAGASTGSTDEDDDLPF